VYKQETRTKKLKLNLTTINF